MQAVLPRYKKAADHENMPAPAERPDLVLCQLVDGKLLLPTDVRQHFLTCPIYGQEWRKILSDFDRQWGVQQIANSTQQDSEAGEEKQAQPGAGQSGPGYIVDEPSTASAVKEKYGDPVAQVPIPEFSAVIMVYAGPVAFIHAKEALTLLPSQPLLTHGAGTWLVGAKATKFENDRPKTAVPCQFFDDLSLVALEDCQMVNVPCFLQICRRMAQTRGLCL